jgi:DNA-binding GntR family transcriptional regulator
MWAQVDRIMYAILQLQDYMSVVWDEHARIIDALEDKDADAAAQRMEQHLQQASQRLIQQAD